MANYQWYVTEKRKKLMEEAKKLPEKDLSTIFERALEEYLKIHSDGNPIYKLEKWTDNPEFIAVPALLSPFDFWVKWFTLNKKDSKLITEIRAKTQELTGLLKKWEYGKL